MLTHNNTQKLLLTLYALVLSVFSMIRLIFFLTGYYRIGNSVSFFEIGKAFLIGIRFDVVIASYLLIVPALILLILDFFKKGKAIVSFVFLLVFILFSVSFLISVSDIPYFDHFFNHLSVGVFHWMDAPGIIIKMILQEPKYYLFLIGGLLVFYVFYRVLKNIFKKYLKKREQPKRNILHGVVIVLTLFLMFVGIRGIDFDEVPIQNERAYFCDDPFVNQLGVSPTFFFLQSYIDDVYGAKNHVDFMEDELAIAQVKQYLNIKETANKIPISRQVTPDSISPQKLNVVLVLMEGMSCAKMTRHGNKHNLTPFLDSLSYQSYYFDNLHSAGEHTFNGIFGTLFSLPSLFHNHPLKEIKVYDGISNAMRNLGYSTTYFTTHNLRFDKVGVFLSNNKFDNIIGDDDYPGEEIKTTFGVPDDYMFRFSMPILDTLNDNEKPFFVTYLTTSDHPPFYLPDYFKPHSEGIHEQMTEYADWSLRRLIELSREKSWFDNTIFVMIADHGASMDIKYDVGINYHHTPMLIYAPKFLKPKLFDKIAGQIDCFPTIMGVLKQPYINATLGIDLLSEERPYIFINSEDKLAVLDKEFMLIYFNENKIKLHKYQNRDPKDYVKEFPEKVEEMLKYLKANLQTYQYINKNSSRLLE